MEPSTEAGHVTAQVTPPTFSLPLTVASLIDLGRLQREALAIDSFLAQAAVREPGKSLNLPKTTQSLEEVCQQNKLNLLVEKDRHVLLKFLQQIHDTAPRIHISFTADPSPTFLGEIVLWLRKKIHPLIILQVGLQPTIAAGCIVRTPNKHFDFSLRKRFDKNQALLIETIRQTRLATQTPAAGPPAPNPAPLTPPVQLQPAQPTPLPHEAAHRAAVAPTMGVTNHVG